MDKFELETGLHYKKEALKEIKNKISEIEKIINSGDYSRSDIIYSLELYELKEKIYCEIDKIEAIIEVENIGGNNGVSS